MKLKSKKKKGFTLIELVAVVAILAILAAVLVPSVSGYITRSRKAAVITQCREVVNAVETYNLTAGEKIKDGDSLIKANEELTKGDLTVKVDKLGKMDVAKARVINSDEEALDRIKLDKDNVYSSYDEPKAKVD